MDNSPASSPKAEILPSWADECLVSDKVALATTTKDEEEEEDLDFLDLDYIDDDIVLTADITEAEENTLLDSPPPPAPLLSFPQPPPAPLPLFPQPPLAPEVTPPPPSVTPLASVIVQPPPTGAISKTPEAPRRRSSHPEVRRDLHKGRSNNGSRHTPRHHPHRRITHPTPSHSSSSSNGRALWTAVLRKGKEDRESRHGTHKQQRRRRSDATTTKTEAKKKKKANHSRNAVCRRVYLDAKDYHRKAYKYVVFRWLYHENRQIKNSKTGSVVTFEDIWRGFTSENPDIPTGEVARCALPIMMGLSSLWNEDNPTLGQKVGEYILRRFT